MTARLFGKIAALRRTEFIPSRIEGLAMTERAADCVRPCTRRYGARNDGGRAPEMTNIVERDKLISDYYSADKIKIQNYAKN